MERITQRDKDACGLIDFSDYRRIETAVERLAAYEDTGLTPEEVQELVLFRKNVEKAWNEPAKNNTITVEIPVGWKATGPAWWILQNLITARDIRTEDDVKDLMFLIDKSVLVTDDLEEYGLIYVDPKAKTIVAKPFEQIGW